MPILRKTEIFEEFVMEKKIIYLKAEQLPVLTGIKNKLEKYMELNEGYRTVMVQFDLND